MMSIDSDAADQRSRRQPVLMGVCGRSRSRRHVELDEDVAQMSLDRLLAQHQYTCNVGVAPPSSLSTSWVAGAALSRAKVLRATASSAVAESSSPISRNARAKTTRARAASYGDPRSLQRRPDSRALLSASSVSPNARWTVAAAYVAIARSAELPNADAMPVNSTEFWRASSRSRAETRTSTAAGSIQDR